MTPLQNCGELQFTQFVPTSHTLPYGWRLTVAAQTVALIGEALPSSEQEVLGPAPQGAAAHSFTLANYWRLSLYQPFVLLEGKLWDGLGT